jgi:periodic tryptophan protein 1
VEDDDEIEDIKIQASDNLILAGKTEDDVSHLEVYVYDNAEDNLYVHHDIMLPSFPICVEWINFSALGDKGGQSFAAVGTFLPEIEIWSLDVMDAMYPDIILGKEEGQGSLKKKKKSSRKGSKHRHTDAVMALSWNRLAGNILASSSADGTVKLWNLDAKTTAIESFDHHNDKVACVEFNPVEASILLSGSYDKTIAVWDARSATDSMSTWNVASDAECLQWDPHHPTCFLASFEDGIVKYYDCRMNSKEKASKKGAEEAVFTLSAHSGPVSALSVNQFIPDMVVTGSADKTVKLWDIAGGKPTLVCSRDLDAGKVFSANFALDSPYLCAVAGSTGNLVIWNITENAGVRKTFEGREGGRAGQVSMHAEGAITNTDTAYSLE